MIKSSAKLNGGNRDIMLKTDKWSPYGKSHSQWTVLQMWRRRCWKAVVCPFGNCSC